MKKIISIIFLFMFSSFVSANPFEHPKFSNYKGPVYKGKAAPLSLSDSYARHYKTRFTEALKESPNFAGEYIITVWGCGTNCAIYSFINKRTGKILEKTFGGELGENVAVATPDSRLLITKKEIVNDDYETLGYMVYYYILQNTKFKKIGEHPISKEAFYAE